MARRYGTGSIYQRSSDGRWIGNLPDGHGGRSRSVTGTTRDEVERKLVKLGKSSTSARRPRSVSVADLLERWLEYVAQSVRPASLIAYDVAVHQRIVPHIGFIRVSDLTSDDVARLMRDLSTLPRAEGKEPYSAATVSFVRWLLGAALKKAIDWGYTDRNVAQSVRRPRVPRHRIEGWSAEQARTFITGTKGDPNWALYVLAITTGMRKGELLALRWKDVDLAAGTVNVTATLRQVDRHRWSWDEPKTATSRRTIVLTRVAIEALSAHQATSTSRWSVFCRPDGRPLAEVTLGQSFHRLADKVGMPRVRFHDLRHTAAHMMLDEMGGDLRAVSATLGHSTIGTTVDIYGGRADEARKRAAQAMDRIMEGIG